jgi:hypothetical protein
MKALGIIQNSPTLDFPKRFIIFVVTDDGDGYTQGKWDQRNHFLYPRN